MYGHNSNISDIRYSGVLIKTKSAFGLLHLKYECPSLDSGLPLTPSPGRSPLRQ